MERMVIRKDFFVLFVFSYYDFFYGLIKDFLEKRGNYRFFWFFNFILEVRSFGL